MKTYNIKITETYGYSLDIEAKDEKEALQKAKNYYRNEPDGVCGVANATSFENVKFKILNKD